ncbi:hypothetical protein ACHQM5_024586 [Ranunculus cassubicifolius]
MAVAETNSTNPNPDPCQSPLCGECGVNPSKYKCPGCSIRSCSLPCVKSHKSRTSCTGKRPRTQFVPLSQFDDNLLVSDYSLLEEAKRTAESAKRNRDGLFGYFPYKLPFKLRNLQNAAARRKTNLLLLPNGMSKREKNQTRYNFRKNLISWTIEWRFHSTDVVLVDNGVDEDTSLCSVFEKHREPGPWNNQLSPFFDQIDSLKFFIRKNAKGSKSPYRELDIKAPLGQQLVDVVIVEYPVIHVFLPSASYEFEVVKDTYQKTDEPVNEEVSSPRGVVCREEEVEDDMSDPQILDLMTYMNPELPMEHEMEGGEGLEETLGDYEIDDFEFAQDLRNAFSAVDPDEYLDYSGFLDAGNVIVSNELEEGEIPE